MPTEQPQLPRETHRSMLAHGGNKHMPLQAGEIATLRPLKHRMRKPYWLIVPVATLVGAWLWLTL